MPSCKPRNTTEVAEIKRRIHIFNEELLALCDADEAPEVVVQIGLQCFPVTQKRSGDGGRL